MTSFLKDDRARTVAIWLFVVAGLVLAMVVVGGATRLTGSGLSITEWRPVTGAIPPLSDEAWRSEFAKYQRIPQFSQINADMTLDGFKTIYWWEWVHRFLGRLVGAVFAIPFVWFLIRRQIPRRLVWRCFGLLALGGFQGFVGWWMVSSGLSERVSVAPERLMSHLGLALILYGALIWCALEAWFGQAREEAYGPWARGGLVLTVLIFIQSLLGALVAANDAGLVFNDWPLMGGRIVPEGYWAGELWQTIAHNQASVQFHHRMFGYLVLLFVVGFVAQAGRSRFIQPEVRRLAFILGGLVAVQVGLGIATVLTVSPLSLSIIHQIVAALALGLAVTIAWRARRV